MVLKAGKEEINTIANLAILMWNSHTLDDLINEFTEIISKGNAQFFLKYENDTPVGFAQCQLLYDYVEGTETTPVGYLEGIYVKETYRKKAMPKNYWQHVKHGRKITDVENLPAIAN
jgi:aminoglycoside 6'-N-acetyltransferase I